MTILISSTQADLSSGDGLGSLLREFGGAGGQPDLFDSRHGTELNEASAALQSLQNAVGSVLERLYNSNQEVFDKSFVGSGHQVIAGGGSISGGTVSPLEDAATIQVSNQTPNLSVLIKKRAFSSLNHLYDPTLMDDDELWLFRATKRLFARKCAEIADYERLTKIKKLLEAGTNAASATISLITGFAAQASDGSGGAGLGADSGVGFFSSMRNLQNAVKDRQPVDVTTWFYDPDVPFDPAMGSGSGVFEITLVSQLNTNLSIGGEGGCNFSLDNPYNILRISEHDIELAIRDTALSKLTNVLDKAAGLSLVSAQTADGKLTKSRTERKKSSITFSVSASGQGSSGTIDAIGMTLTQNNLDLVPEPHSLNNTEKTLVRTILSHLEAYSMATRRNLLDGLSVSGGDNETLKSSMSYARKMLRKFYMGKLIIQPMDTINIFIDSQTRRAGETTGQADSHSPLVVGNMEISGSTMEVVDNISNSLGLQDSWQIDDSLLEAAWEKSGKWLSKQDFKKLYNVSGGSGIHVFGGLVSDVSSNYNAESGRYEVSVNAASNMEWLKLSRYNQQPALQQTEGIIWDPLTPFIFQVDEATGLPIGKADLSNTNKRLIDSGIFLHRGNNAGTKITKDNAIKALGRDVQNIGGSLTPIFEMPPGLKYRWKEGIITTPYISTALNPLDPTTTNEDQLRRDIGFFVTNTPFDTMDPANIISLLVTGYPHNVETFIKSALNTGGFQLDTTLNSGKDYFHSFIDTQKTMNLVQGNFSPFKIINTDRRDLAQAIATQQRLSQKSSELQQLKNQYAAVTDRLLKLTNPNSTGGGIVNSNAQGALKTQQAGLAKQIKSAEKTFNELIDGSSTWRIAGDDVGFDLTNPADKDEAKLFGDRFLFVSQRRREDVIYNRDKNFFIVSEDYDKDFDIQSFALKMRDRAPEMFTNRWESVFELCKSAAESLELEFLCNTQGHIELRPPQYNKTPLSVLSTMLSLNRQSGVRVFPEFLEKLVSTRIESLVTDIKETEFEMCRYAALLGASDITEAKQFIYSGALKYSGSNTAQFIIELGDINAAIEKDQASAEQERNKLKDFISAESGYAMRGSGIFSAASQANFVYTSLKSASAITQFIVSKNSAKFYQDMIDELVKLNGKQQKFYPSFNDAKVGARKNGQSTPASDISAITDRISEQVTRRSKLLRILGKALEQSVEIASANSNGTLQTNFGWSNSSIKPSALFEKMVENDSQNVLGHLSGRRFIIGDENLLSYRMSEKPPVYTVCSVSGSADAIIGIHDGMNGSLPMARAFGADFDLWRQYGFRQERNFDKPYFYDSELQCAPYAKMILTRQHKAILTADVEVVGNEFYQLGDVVYISDLQLVFYVDSVRHSFTYENGFTTSLSLTYGRPPGDYIPTPLDVIGKSLSNTSNLLTGTRIRRLPHRSDQVIGVVRFTKNETDMNGLLNGQDGKRNYDVLSNALTIARGSIDVGHPNSSSRVALMAFGDASNKDKQKARIATVADWLTWPQTPAGKSDNLDAVLNAASTNPNDIIKMVPRNMIIASEPLAQKVSDQTELSSNDRALLRAGVVADRQSWALDESLDTVVEIRLRPVPSGGWPQGT